MFCKKKINHYRGFVLGYLLLVFFSYISRPVVLLSSSEDMVNKLHCNHFIITIHRYVAYWFNRDWSMGKQINIIFNCSDGLRCSYASQISAAIITLVLWYRCEFKRGKKSKKPGKNCTDSNIVVWKKIQDRSTLRFVRYFIVPSWFCHVWRDTFCIFYFRLVCKNGMVITI